MFYPIAAPDGTKILPIGPSGYESRWICGSARFEEMKDAGLIEFINRGTTKAPQWQVHQKFYLSGRAKQPSDFWSNVEGNKKATRDLRSLFNDEKVFDNPKPLGLLERILEISGVYDDDIVLDFFAGSGALGHATMRYAARESVSPRYILVQLPQIIEGDDAVEQAAVSLCRKLRKPPTIAEITKERIRRAGAAILKDNSTLVGSLDTGFRAFRIDSGNLHNTRLTPAEATQAALSGMISHIKDDRSDEDLLFGALLRWGVDITLPIARRELLGRTIWLVDLPAGGETGAALIACFAKASGGRGGIDTELADALAKLAPLRVLFRDDGFASDAVKENVASRLKQRAPDAAVRVL